MIARFYQYRSIRFRITTAIFLLFFVGLWLLSTYLGRALREDLGRVLGEQQLSATSMVTAHVNEELHYRLDTLQKYALSVVPLLQRGGDVIRDDLYHRSLLHALFNAGVFFCEFNPTSRISHAETDHFCQDFSNRKSILATLQTGKPSVGDLIFTEDKRNTSFGVAVPVFDEKGKLVSALVGVTKLGEGNFLDKLTNSPYGLAGDYLIISPQYHRVISATNGAFYLKDIAHTDVNELFERFVHGEEGTQILRNLAKIESLTSNRVVSASGWVVMTSLPISEAFSPIVQLEMYMRIGMFALVVFVTLVSWFVLKSQLAPLSMTVKRIDDMVHSRELLAVLPVTSHDEVGNLIQSFNHLLKKLERRENSLRESEIFSRSILNSVPAEIAVLDQFGTITMVNQPWLRFTDIINTEGEVNAGHSTVGMNYLDVCRNSVDQTSNRDAALVLDGVSAVLEGRLPTFSLEYALRVASKSHWFSLDVTPLNHDAKGAVVSHTDITERKHIEEALRLVWASVQAASEAIFWLTKEANIIDINTAACQLLAYTEEELMQMSVKDIHPEPPFDRVKWQRHFAKIQKHGAIKFETVLRAKNGDNITVEISSNYIQHGDKEFICAFVRDISERKRTEVALKSAKAEAEKANHAKSRFLAAASHDLRQPLSALALYVDLLRQYKDPRTNEVVKNIQGCVASMSELLTDLLDISKLDAGVVKANPTIFSIDDLLQKMVQIFTAESDAKKLKLRFKPSRVIACCDQRLMHRVIGNLISNAIRYTEKGGVLIACRAHQGKQFVEVWDTGIGIPESQTEIIFEEFRQLGDEARNRGSGLGLAIVKKMTALLGLEVKLRSRLGHGSVFSIEIPVASHTDFTQEKLINGVNRNALIAVVDDNAEVLNALSLTLGNAGYQVIATSNGKTLMERMEKQRPDLIISDYRLAKGENGFDVIAATRAIAGANLPAILITGDTDPDLMRTMQDSSIAILYKPLHFVKLQALINFLLKNQKL